MSAAIVSLIAGVAFSLGAQAAPPVTVVPPTGVVATALSSSSIRVTWVDTNSTESGYEIERSLSANSGFTVVRTTGADVTSWTDTGRAAGTRYHYRLRAFEPGKGNNKPDEFSDYSATVSAQTFSATTTSTSSSTSSTVIGTSTSTSSTTSTTTGGNQPPVAEAGPNKSLAVGQLGTFDGRASFDPDGTIVAWLWNFGDGGNWGNTSIEQRAYSAPGTYTVTLYVQDNAGAWSADTLQVTVGGAVTTTTTSTSTTTSTNGSNQLPVANAGPDKSLAVGQVGTFDGRASFDPDGVIVSYLWNFGDGGVWGSSALEFRAYSAPGTYTVTLYVQDNAGAWTADTAIVTVGGSATTTSSTTSTSTSSSTSTTVQTNQPPVSNAGPDKQGTVGQSLTFDGRNSFDPDGSITAYLWQWGDGGSATTALASHTYQSPGSYNAVLWVQDNAGAWSMDTAVAAIAGTGGGEWLGRETGTSNQQTTAVARTGSSDVAVGGFSIGTAQIGSITLSGVAGRLDGYVARYASNGTVSWAQQLAPTTSTAMVIVEGVAGDGSGNVVAVGRFTGSMRAGGVTLTSAGAQDMFVVKFGSTGSVQWARRYGGSAGDAAYGAGVDSGGNVYATGYYTGAVDFGGGVLQENKIVPAATLFALKLTSTGTHVWSRSFAGTASEIGYGLAVAPNGDVVLGGSFSDRLDLGAGQLRTLGVTDGFVLQLTPAGAHRWSRQVGGSSFDEVLAVAADSSGNVAITGKFRGTANFGGPSLTANATVSDMFVASYTGTGAYRWARSGGSSFNEDSGSGVAFDGSGNVCVTGSFMSTATFGSGSVTSAGGRDVFLVEYGANGSYRGVDAWGGSGNDEGLDVTAWGTGQVAVAGFFRDTAVLAGQVVTSAGGSDGFTARVVR